MTTYDDGPPACAYCDFAAGVADQLRRAIASGDRNLSQFLATERTSR